MIKRASVVALGDPYITSHGGTIRTRGFLSALAAEGIDTQVLTPSKPLGEQGAAASSARGHSFISRLRGFKRQLLPVATFLGARDTDLGEAIRKSNAEVLVYGAFAQLRYQSSHGAPFWLDFMDVLSDVAEREASARTGLSKLTAGLQARNLRRLERKFCTRAAVVTAAGYTDTMNLRARGVDAIWLPTWLPDNAFTPEVRRASHQRVAGLFANFEYRPNVDAYWHLVNSWLRPLQDAGWEVVVAGRHSSDLPSVDGITNMGEVDSPKDFYDMVSLTLAPIRLGGGIKVKIVEAMAQGCPVLATPFAMDGFPPTMLQGVTVWSDGEPLPPIMSQPVSALAQPSSEDVEVFSASHARKVIRNLLKGI